MNYLGKVINNFRYVYNEINAATLTGAIDVIVVEQPDGTFTCSPFHVRFGKIGVLRSREKIVEVEINGEPVDIHMKLGESGEAFFVEGTSSDENVPPHLATSPIPDTSGFSPSFDDSGTSEWKGIPNKLGDLKNSDNNDSAPVVIVAGSVPKTFCAETVDDPGENEKIRKISIAAGEFRPIDSEPFLSEMSESLRLKQSLSGLDLSNDVIQTYHEEAVRTSSSLPVSRKKRRKKSVMKKKASYSVDQKNDSSSSSNEHQGESEGRPDTKPEESFTENIDSSIFQMEDLDFNKPKTSMDEVPDLNDTKSELSRVCDAPIESDIHFFSDTEITPGCSPPVSREFAPIKSDSEFEIQRTASVGSKNELTKSSLGAKEPQQSWKWGELPSPPLVKEVSPKEANNEEEAKKQQEAAAHRSMLQNMLGFMKKTKHMRQSEGIYLSELNPDELDPEIAALYFPSTYKNHNLNSSGADSHHYLPDHDEDAESGNGSSLPHSPHSVLGSPTGQSTMFHPPEDVHLSLCGGLGTVEGPTEEAFLSHLVDFNQLANDPSLLENSNLVVKIGGKLYNWRTAAPIIVSMVTFHKFLPPETVERLCRDWMPKSNKKPASSNRSYSSWFMWSRGSDSKSNLDASANSANASAIMDEGKNLEDKSKDISTERSSDKVDGESSLVPDKASVPDKSAAATEADNEETGKSAETVRESEKEEVKKVDFEEKTVSDQVVPEGISNPAESPKPTEVKTSDSVQIPLSNVRRKSDGLRLSESHSSDSDTETNTASSSDKFRKTLRLSSEQIAKLKLLQGSNEVVFSVTTAYQGTSRCKCFLFLWRYDDKIVISDIDGTITKSDVLGHILPIVGKDWAQSGVAKLFTKIKNNGYKLLYLSARAIGQSRVTRDYLKSIKQEDLSLPEGPMLLNPTSLLNAFHTEVIEKKPEEFKIQCLRDILALFPPNSKPFYAGYGNKINDVWAYQAVGIPIFRIFTINHRGELKHELTQTFQSSYSSMTFIVDQMFPSPPEESTMEDFSQFSYWRDPIPAIDLKIEKDP
ncbi:unnamed protein product [Bemisia tabaci]|uniref:phosphatidate phosphatase n=1 Tax=Bemisia tabaci TaxID=7038 RepID=A0A9P0F4H9_BEMTA|nr:unnamed protein product [Bemisia tabaci]